jgi:hypothetical protein
VTIRGATSFPLGGTCAHTMSSAFEEGGAPPRSPAVVALIEDLKGAVATYVAKPR